MRKIVSLLVIAILALCFVSCSSNSPESVVEKYIKCLQNQKYEDAVDLMYFKEDVSSDSKDQMVALMKMKAPKELEEKQGIKDYKIESTELSEDGESAKVTASVTYGNGKTMTETMKVVKADGKWLIDLDK